MHFVWQAWLLAGDIYVSFFVTKQFKYHNLNLKTETANKNKYIYKKDANWCIHFNTWTRRATRVQIWTFTVSGDPPEDFSAGTADSAVNCVVCLLAKEERKNPCRETGWSARIDTKRHSQLPPCAQSHAQILIWSVVAYSTSVQG